MLLTKLIVALIAFLGLFVGIALYRLNKEEIEIIKPYLLWTKILLLGILSVYNILKGNIYVALIFVLVSTIYIRLEKNYLIYPFLALLLVFSNNLDLLFVNSFLIFSFSIIIGTFIDYEQNWKKEIIKLIPFILIALF
jgi:hypothetical protein